MEQPAPRRRRLELAPVADQIPACRAEVREMIGDLLGEDRTVGVLVAVNEAVTNAIRHADAKHISVDVECGETAIDICVTDDGAGMRPVDPEMPSPDQPGGRGLPLMDVIADDFRIDSGPNGTTVCLRIDLVPAEDHQDDLVNG